MSDTSSDASAADLEDALREVTVATWNRVRSTTELADFVDRRHMALGNVEL